MRTLGERFIPDIEFDKIYIQGFAIVGDAKANEAQIVEKLHISQTDWEGKNGVLDLYADY